MSDFRYMPFVSIPFDLHSMLFLACLITTALTALLIRPTASQRYPSTMRMVLSNLDVYVYHLLEGLVSQILTLGIMTLAMNFAVGKYT